MLAIMAGLIYIIQPSHQKEILTLETIWMMCELSQM